MSIVRRVRPKIGDLIEIPTPKGMAYAQYTHKHNNPPKFGPLLRVFPGLYDERPDDFSRIVNLKPQIITFFPLGAACNRKIVTIVSNEPVPEEAKAFPTFRSGIRDREGKVNCWWLWDGQREWKVGSLSPGMEKFPIRGVWSDTLLIERIVKGWSRENVT